VEPGEDLLFSGVVELSRQIRDRTLSPVDLAEAVLARIGAGGRLGCFAAVTAERARTDARSAEAELSAGRWRGPLHGIPCGLEDLIDTAGIPTTLGSARYADRIPAQDAVVAARLGAAGAVLAGKLTLDELGGPPGAGRSGPARNPWDPGQGAGGAAGGAAAAVAGGLVPFALAAETVNGLAGPAASCGVTALRPTYGALPLPGVMPVSYSLDVVGVLARSAADCALVLATLAGADPTDPASIPAPRGLGRVRPEIPPGLRVGVLALPEVVAADPQAARAYQDAQDALRDAGALLAPAELPELPWEAVAALLAGAEAASARQGLLGGAPSAGGDPPLASAIDYVRAARLRAEGQRRLAALFTRHDLLLAPSPPRLGLPGGPATPFDPVGAAVALGGLPCLALPVGFAGALPLSARLVAPPLEEARLLGAGAIFQARTAHHLARPPAPAVAVTAR